MSKIALVSDSNLLCNREGNFDDGIEVENFNLLNKPILVSSFEIGRENGPNDRFETFAVSEDFLEVKNSALLDEPSYLSTKIGWALTYVQIIEIIFSKEG